MSDLLEDLVGEILARVPLISLKVVRCTCKNWNALSTARKQFLGFMLMDSRVYSMKLDLQGIRNHGYIVNPSINQVSVFAQVEISKVFHCHGLFLCVTKDQKLVVWNPYLGQTRWIPRLRSFSIYDMLYGLGYDNYRNYHKILRFGKRENDFSWTEIYDCNSDSWRVVNDTADWDMHHQSSMSLNGNTYFIAREKLTKDTEVEKNDAWSLLGFDYTAERFGPLLPLPFQSYAHHSSESVALSCVRDEQLALLFQRKDGMMEIWITTKIDPKSVSWSMFLKVDTSPLPHFPGLVMAGTFFICEEKKAVVVSSFRKNKDCCYKTAYITGKDGYFKSVDIGEARIINGSTCMSVVKRDYRLSFYLVITY
ncbi:unnamed protein product [Microthlaspi erraticum]|uniref:F-box domain-containing protein n=1 Tax=Microthlaspi erraticum TaxID=1685480 RepID=A0A6D2K2H7_9BRAS|nr:unnamed protein product [Microthlaspi erraticum]